MAVGMVAHRRTLAVVGSAVVGALLAFASGCGEEPSEIAHKEVTGAAAALRAAGTAAVRFDMALVNLEGDGDEASWKGTSRVRYGDQPAAETEFTSFDSTVFDIPTSGPNVGLATTQTHQIDLREITVGETRYHRSSKLSTPRGKPWVKLTKGQYALYGTTMANPDSGALDPQTYLDLLAGLDTAATAGTMTDDRETVDGVQTRRYQLVCTLGEGPCASASLGVKLQDLFPGAGNTFELQFWLDDEGRPRKLDVEAHLERRSTSKAALYQLRGTLSLSEFGRPVAVAEPPDAEVTTEYRLAL